MDGTLTKNVAIFFAASSVQPQRGVVQFNVTGDIGEDFHSRSAVLRARSCPR